MTTFWTPAKVFAAGLILRIVFLLYGLVQDVYSSMKFTDIDYLVFTDASRYVSRGLSPYHRETYRYTPLLAWLLLPTTYGGQAWFSFGKVVFSLADLLAGWGLLSTLRDDGRADLDAKRALKFASIWLLNPFVATISTRGSSEGLLSAMVVMLLWAVKKRKIALAGFLLGLSVHFKIYPFIYAPTLFIWLESPGRFPSDANILQQVRYLLNRNRLTLVLISAITFVSLNVWMYALYGMPFLQHTYFHHLTRVDHRHNFSAYSTLLYFSAAVPSDTYSFLKLESLAFLPQLGLSAIIIPLILTKRDLAGTMLAQTWVFVAFNKVCTSQYFIWYLTLLPLYMPYSSFLKNTRLGLIALILWVVPQAAWVQQAFQLEFLGNSTFIPGLLSSGLGFFIVNCWMLGIVIDDVARQTPKPSTNPAPAKGIKNS